MSIEPEGEPLQETDVPVEEEKQDELLDLLRSINNKLDNLVQVPREPVPTPEPQQEPQIPPEQPPCIINNDGEKQSNAFQKHKLFFVIGAAVIFISFFSFMDLFQNPQIFFFILIFISFIFVV